MFISVHKFFKDIPRNIDRAILVEKEAVIEAPTFSIESPISFSKSKNSNDWNEYDN